ncbi:MAG: hypothetical protein ACOX1A_06210 [Saccharofermentanales bacterium]|jgi:hypothetical protein|nr:hypothetical protein [Clostridiaceae bacterium]
MTMNRPGRKGKKRISLVVGLLLAALLLLALTLVLFKVFQPAPSTIKVDFPGAATGRAADFRRPAQVADNLEARLKLLLQKEKSYLLASRYRLAGPFGRPPAERSDIYHARDQLLYGQYLMEQKLNREFNRWWREFSSVFLQPQGIVAIHPQQTPEQALADDDFWPVNLQSARLLAQSCSVWPNKAGQESLGRLSDQLLELGSRGFSADYDAAVPTLPPILDPGATPTPKPTATPAVTEPLPVQRILRLSTLDLFTMQQLVQVDQRWQKLYDQYLPIVKNGYINDSLPLYAFGYIDHKEGYLTYSGSMPFINTEEALTTLLHLCEVGQENDRSISWLRDQMFNHRAIYEFYHIALGSAGSNVESVPAYAIVARIARIKGDADLYEAAVNRLLWHQATSQTSAALSAVFRQDSEGLIHVLAADNVMALLALR